MSCGPSKALAGLAEKVDLANEKIDELILQPTIGKLDDLKQQAEDELNGMLGDLEAMIPEIDLGIEIPEELKSLQDDFKDVGNFLLLGLAKKDALVNKMAQIESKWGNVDLGDFENLQDISKALMTGAADIDSLCKLLPNVQTDGIDISVKGTPLSFPNLDLGAIILGDDVPKFKKPKFELDIKAIKKSLNSDFFTTRIPNIDF